MIRRLLSLLRRREPQSVIVSGWRTCDAMPKRMFGPDEEVDSLLAELTDLERRLESFARRVQRANLNRPGDSRRGFYSSPLAMIGATSNTWIGRVKQYLQQDKWLMEAFPQQPPPAPAKEHHA
jgi:hypothetical protein